MTRYCMNCGKEIDGRKSKCPYCKTPHVYGEDNNVFKAEKIYDPVVIITAVVSLILMAVIVILNLTVFNNKYKEPIDNIVSAVESGDVDYLIDAYPEYITDGNEDELENDLKISHKSFKLVLGEDFEISYEIINKEKIPRDELNELPADVSEEYDEDISVSDGYSVEADFTYEGDSITKTITQKINVYKIDGDWCAYDNLTLDLLS